MVARTRTDPWARANSPLSIALIEIVPKNFELIIFFHLKKKEEEGELSHFKMVPKLNIRNLTQVKILFFTKIVYINV